MKLFGRTSCRRNTPKMVDHKGTLKFTKLIKIAPLALINETRIIVAIPVGNIPRYRIASTDSKFKSFGYVPRGHNNGAQIKLAIIKE